MNTPRQLQNTEEARKLGWTLEDINRFIEALTSFEKHLSKLFSKHERPPLKDILIKNIYFSVDDPGMSSGIGLGMSCNGDELLIDPAKLKPERFFKYPSLLIGHEYGHLLIFHPDLLWPSLPQVFKDNLKKENYGKDYLFMANRVLLRNMVFYALISDGLDNLYFNGLRATDAIAIDKLDEALDYGLLKNISDAYFETIAERIVHLTVSTWAQAELKFEREDLEENLLFYNELIQQEKNNYGFYPTIAYYIAYAKNTNNADLLQDLNLGEIENRLGKYQDDFQRTIDSLSSLWNGISIKGKKDFIAEFKK